MTIRPAWWDTARAFVIDGLAGPTPERVARLDRTLDRVLSGSAEVVARTQGERRWTPLTPTGAPIEVKVVTGTDQIRYTATPGLSAGYFRPRLSAELDAFGRAAADLSPPTHAAISGDARTMVEALFPDTGAISPRERHGTYIGVAHAADGALSGLRLYGNLRASPCSGRRLAERIEPFRRLADLVDDSLATPVMAAVQVDEPGQQSYKLYVCLLRDDPGKALDQLGEATAANAAGLRRAARELGVSVRALRRSAIVALRVGRAGTAVGLTLHLTRGTLGDDAAQRWRAVDRLCDWCRSDSEFTGRVKAVRSATENWEPSVIALATAPDGAVAQTSLYLAPVVRS